MSKAKPSGSIESAADEGGDGPRRRHLGDRAVAVVGDVEVAGGVEGQAVGTIEPAADEGGDGPRGRHLGDRVVPCVGDVEVAGGVEGQAIGDRRARC